MFGSTAQVHLVFSSIPGRSIQAWKIYLFQFFTLLSYVNSAVNPFLYAFTNEGFKTSFAAACGCITNSTTSIVAPSANQNATSTVPGSRRGRGRPAAAARIDDRPLTVITRAQITRVSQSSRGCCDEEPEVIHDFPDDRQVLAQIEEKDLSDGCEGSDGRLTADRQVTDCV